MSSNGSTKGLLAVVSTTGASSVGSTTGPLPVVWTTDASLPGIDGCLLCGQENRSCLRLHGGASIHVPCVLGASVHQVGTVSVLYSEGHGVCQGVQEHEQLPPRRLDATIWDPYTPKPLFLTRASIMEENPSLLCPACSPTARDTSSPVLLSPGGGLPAGGTEGGVVFEDAIPPEKHLD